MPDREPAAPSVLREGGVQITPVLHGLILSLKTGLAGRVAGPLRIRLDGHEFPSAVGTTSSGGVRILCVGPEEWLALGRGDHSLPERLEPYRSSHGLVVIDLSDAFIGVRVEGKEAPELLGSGCGLDLDPMSFPEGACARTRFAQIPAVIACLSRAVQYELLVSRSYGPWLVDWLLDARRSF